MLPPRVIPASSTRRTIIRVAGMRMPQPAAAAEIAIVITLTSSGSSSSRKKVTSARTLNPVKYLCCCVQRARTS
jgi:hypothetical protein